MLTEPEKAYLAGFFDGDGCVNISSRKGRASRQHFLQITFSQCDRPFLERWRNKVGIGSVHVNRGRGNFGATKDLWHWRLFDRQAETMLRLMLPYLDIKKEQAEVALKFMDTKGTAPKRLSAGVLKLREYYKNVLHNLKGKDIELSPEMVESERLQDGQLALFEAKPCPPAQRFVLPRPNGSTKG